MVAIYFICVYLLCVKSCKTHFSKKRFASLLLSLEIKINLVSTKPIKCSRLVLGRNVYTLLCFLTCVLQKILKTEAKRVEPSPSATPVNKSVWRTIEVETGTSCTNPTHDLPGIETLLEALKHSLFGGGGNIIALFV